MAKKLMTAPVAGDLMQITEGATGAVKDISPFSTQRFVNVLDQGAKGDGVTDDTAAINSAINSLTSAPNGGTVFFPRGTYLCADVDVKTGVFLEGVGQGSILMASGNTTNGVVYFSGNKGGLNKLKIDGQAGTYTATGISHSRTGGWGNTITRVRIDNCSGVGSYSAIIRGTTNTYESVLFDTGDTNCVLIEDGQDTLLTRCIFQGDGCDGAAVKVTASAILDTVQSTRILNGWWEFGVSSEVVTLVECDTQNTHIEGGYATVNAAQTFLDQSILFTASAKNCTVTGLRTHGLGSSGEDYTFASGASDCTVMFPATNGALTQTNSGTNCHIVKHHALEERAVVFRGVTSSSVDWHCVIPWDCTIIKIYAVLEGIIDTADEVITMQANGTNMTNGQMTFAYSGSTDGDQEECTPTGNNTITAGQLVTASFSGASGLNKDVQMTVVCRLG